MFSEATLTMFILLVAAAVCFHARADDRRSESRWTDCRGATVRGKLMWVGRSGKESREIEEGPRILLDADSYPREPARLVSGPELVRDGDKWRIRFALDRPDDVLVRVVDCEGEVVRTLGCGVLGPNAPEPFQKNSLEQKLTWDGLHADGNPAPSGSRVQVSVGLEPRFQQFVGYDRNQLTNFVSGLSVDRKGRLYVALHTGLRFDPVMLRFDHDGSYLDMVYPSDPAQLRAAGKSLRDVYEPVEHFNGHDIPIKESVWRYWIQRWEDYMEFPFQIAPDGETGYLVIGTPTRIERMYTVDDADARIFTIEDLDRFWWQPWDGPWHYGPVFLWRWDGAFAFDREGYLYVATKCFDGGHGDYAIGDCKALGTVRKVDPKTGRNIPAFSHNGTVELPAKSAYLGTPGTVLSNEELEALAAHVRPGAPVPERDPRDSEHSFLDIEDLAVDDDDNILVADGHPRRIKCYDPDGRWLGGVTDLEIYGERRQFLDLANVFWANGALYVLTKFREHDGRMHLLKCTGAPPEFEVTWSVPLDPLARFIAVDVWAKTPLVWVGNGGGRATITRIEDLGHRAGAPRHFGGIGERRLVYPWTFAAGEDEHLFVHDYARSQIVHTDDAGAKWETVEVPRNTYHWDAAVHRRTTYADHHHRDREMAPRSMLVDKRSRRLLVSFRAGVDSGQASPGFRCYDFDLRPVDFTLESPEESAGEKIERTRRALRWPWDTKTLWGPVLGGFDGKGNLYVTPLNWMRTDNIPEKLPAVVWKYSPDGALMDPGHCRYYLSAGNMAVDSRGSVYVYDVGRVPPAKAQYDFPDMTWGYWRKPKPLRKGPYLMQRGGEPVTHISEICHVVKFGPEGGERFTEDELWAHRGGSVHVACGGCDFPANLLDCDGADRILAADVAHYCVNVLETAGNLIGRFGTYGNAETVPGPEGDADELGFRNIYCISAAGDAVYVCDKDLRRIAKVRMEYRQTSSSHIPGDMW